MRRCAGSVLVQIKSKKPVLDDADETSPTRQHEVLIDHTDQGYICPEKICITMWESIRQIRQIICPRWGWLPRLRPRVVLYVLLYLQPKRAMTLVVVHCCRFLRLSDHRTDVDSYYKVQHYSS